MALDDAGEKDLRDKLAAASAELEAAKKANDRAEASGKKRLPVSEDTIQSLMEDIRDLRAALRGEKDNGNGSATPQKPGGFWDWLKRN